jgi:hypothetical protein
VEPSDHDTTMAQLEATLARLEAQAHQPLAPEAPPLGERLDTLQARNTETLKRLDALALDPAKMETSLAQVRRMAQKDVHPTWMHAAYADLTQRLARVEALLEDLGDSMSLLHTKMETIIGQLAASERQQDGGRDA